MNSREKSITIFLLSFFLTSLVFRSPVVRNESVEDIAREGGGSSALTTTTISSTNTVEEPKYYAKPVHIVENVAHETEELLLQSREQIPKTFGNNFVDVDELLKKSSEVPNLETDIPEEEQEEDSHSNRIVPFYWHVPRSGGRAISKLLGQCLGLTLASSSSIYKAGHNEHSKKVFKDHSDELRIQWFDQSIFANVNLNARAGLHRAARLGIIQNNITYQDEDYTVDVLMSPALHDVSNILFEDAQVIDGTKPRASMFAMFRRPIEREISHFYHMKRHSDVEVIHTYELPDWLRSDHYVANIMTRTLVNKLNPNDPLTLDDLKAAKDILRQKCIVGLLEKKAESWERFKYAYRMFWDKGSVNKDDRAPTPPNCEAELLSYNWPNKNHYNIHSYETRLGSVHADTIAVLTDLNQYDLNLYEYARSLFKEQSKFFK